jgi:hypothetical protein
LHHVFGFRSVFHDAPGHPQNEILVSVDNGRQCIITATNQETHQGAIIGSLDFGPGWRRFQLTLRRDVLFQPKPLSYLLGT